LKPRPRSKRPHSALERSPPPRPRRRHSCEGGKSAAQTKRLFVSACSQKPPRRCRLPCPSSTAGTQSPPAPPLPHRRKGKPTRAERKPARPPRKPKSVPSWPPRGAARQCRPRANRKLRAAPREDATGDDCEAHLAQSSSPKSRRTPHRQHRHCYCRHHCCCRCGCCQGGWVMPTRTRRESWSGGRWCRGNGAVATTTTVSGGIP